MWLLTISGLYSYDYETERMERHGYDPQSGDVFLSQDFNSIYEDADGIAWAGMWQGGLARYDAATGAIHSYTRNDGLPSMSIQGILPDDENGALWLSTFDGLSRYDIASGQFLNFSLADGIQGQLFADGSALVTSQGLYVFGGSHGITTFSSDVLSSRSVPPRVFLSGLYIDNERVVPGEKSVLEHPIYETEMIRLKHDQNNVSISFSALHYSDPSRNSIMYKLEPFDLDWRDAGSQFTAYYPRLSSGSYTFRVKAANNHGVWNEEGASVQLTILPPWWRTIWAYGFYALLFAGVAFALDRYQRQRLVRQERERARETELAQAKEIEKAYHKLEEAHGKLEAAHTNLKAAQEQLVQQEKLASLGQLTAGIAHEIKNPLNFVNNFSGVSIELLEEAFDEIAKLEKSEISDEISAILTDVKANLSKIYEHGSRADGIVQSMLLHSRGGDGKMEPTPLNPIIKEYVNLAFHGMRAGKEPIDVDIDLQLDESVGDVPLIAEDFSRVILNLVNNSFDAMRDKQGSGHKEQGAGGYEPKLTVRTKSLANAVTIEIEDNGPGIPDEIKDKILQPFFTTKKGTQGTGLGLSITNDIVKAHGGDMQIVSEPGSTVFSIRLNQK